MNHNVVVALGVAMAGGCATLLYGLALIAVTLLGWVE